MPAESEIDRQAMLDPADFGIEARWTPQGRAVVVFSAIFDDEYSQAFDTGIAGIEATDPRITCSAADVAGIAQGDGIEVAGRAYRVQSVQQDGTGGMVVTMHANGA